jgi:hypothetical protein
MQYKLIYSIINNEVYPAIERGRTVYHYYNGYWFVYIPDATHERVDQINANRLYLLDRFRLR